MTRVVLPATKPFALNVVAVVYRFELGRYARNKVHPPLEIEALLGTTREGRPWPRLAVPFVFGLRFTELLLFTVPPGIAAFALSQAVERSAPTVALVLDVAGVVVTLFSVVLLGVAGAWCLLPERRTGGYLRYPERLWGASVGVLVVETLIGLVAWGAV
jgi:hypothetical protein